MRLRCAALRIVQAPPAGAVCCLLRIVLGVGYVLTATLLAVCLTAATLSANTWKWRVENVDTAGKFTSIAVDHDGNVHLSYSEGANTKYGFRPAGDSSKWFTMVIDGNGSFTNLALDAQGHPHICYTQRVIKYAHWDGAKWQIQSLATDNALIGFSCSIAVNAAGSPFIAWYRERNGDDTLYGHLKFAELQDGAWIVRTLDFDSQTGKWESMTTDAQGNPVIAFDAYVKGILKFAQRDRNNNWKISTVDFRGRTNQVYDVGMGNSLVLDKHGSPVISYEDGEDVKLARPDGDTWKVETIDSLHPLGSWVGYRTSLALDQQGFPHIAYDAGGLLKHAYWDGQKWVIQILTHPGIQEYRYCSIAIDQNNRIFVSYTDPDDGSVKVAVGEPAADAGDPAAKAAK